MECFETKKIHDVLIKRQFDSALALAWTFGHLSTWKRLFGCHFHHQMINIQIHTNNTISSKLPLSFLRRRINSNMEVKKMHTLCHSKQLDVYNSFLNWFKKKILGVFWENKKVFLAAVIRMCNTVRLHLIYQDDLVSSFRQPY